MKPIVWNDKHKFDIIDNIIYKYACSGSSIKNSLGYEIFQVNEIWWRWCAQQYFVAWIKQKKIANSKLPTIISHFLHEMIINKHRINE